MAKESKLQGVANNTLDHAVSGLGLLPPHVTDFCLASGERRLRLELLPTAPVSTDGRLPGPLRLAAEACRERFVHILTHAGLQLSDVSAAHLEFELLGDDKAAAFSCECILQSSRERRYVASMNSETYWSRKREDPYDALRKLRHGGNPPD